MFHEVLDALEEPCGGRTIDQPVVERQAQRHHLTHGNRLGLLADDDRACDDTADAEDGALRQVDDGRKCVDLVHS